MTRLSGEKHTAQRFSVAAIDWIPDTVALLRKKNYRRHTNTNI